MRTLGHPRHGDPSFRCCPRVFTANPPDRDPVANDQLEHVAAWHDRYNAHPARACRSRGDLLQHQQRLMRHDHLRGTKDGLLVHGDYPRTIRRLGPDVAAAKGSLSSRSAS